MNLKKLQFTTLALIALLGVGACRKNSASNQPATVSADSAERQHPDGGVTAAVETKFS